MYAALAILVLLIDATPALLIVAQPIFAGIACAATSIIAIIVGYNLRRTESRQLANLLLPVAIAALLPAGWMLIQILPSGSSRWAHPVWQSAAMALGEPTVGSLSIDRGLTLVALCNYLLAVGIVLVSAAVAIDRDRAKWILLALTGATTLIAILLITDGLTGVQLFSNINPRESHDAAIDSVALGAILCAIATVRLLDRYQRIGARKFAPTLVASLAAFAVCVSALVGFGTSQGLFALGFGLATLLSGFVIRYLNLGPWGMAGIAALMTLAASSAIATQPRVYTSDPTLAFATADRDAITSITQRILTDGSWNGSGAGTFSVLVPIYKDLGDSIADSTPPTAAAALAVEFGYPAVWAALLMALLAVVLLFRGTLTRGRDWFYPAGSAACIVATALLAFSSAGILHIATTIILATTIGLGFAQSKSRTSSYPDRLSATTAGALRHAREASDVAPNISGSSAHANTWPGKTLSRPL